MFCGLWVCDCVCVCHLNITMSCAKTDELIEIPFLVRTWVGPKNHVLGGGLGPLGEMDNFEGRRPAVHPSVTIL